MSPTAARQGRSCLTHEALQYQGVQAKIDCLISASLPQSALQDGLHQARSHHCQGLQREDERPFFLLDSRLTQRDQSLADLLARGPALQCPKLGSEAADGVL